MWNTTKFSDYEYVWSTIAKKNTPSYLNAVAMVNLFVCKMLYFKLTCTECARVEHLRNDVIPYQHLSLNFIYFFHFHMSYSFAPSLSFHSMTNSG